MHLINLSDLAFIHVVLRSILWRIEQEFGPQTITSLFRVDDPGPHGTLPLRAIDIRCRNPSIGSVIAEWVNQRWTYDPDRPGKKVAIAHGQGKNYHIHIQVHPGTSKNRKAKG